MCVSRVSFVLACLSIGVTLLATPARAQPTPDANVWIQGLALGELSENWRSHLEVQPRWVDGASELGLSIIRVAIGRRVSKRVTVYVGHAWIPRTLGEGVRHEQRIWQQLSLTGPVVAGWALTGRLRVEQRWLEPWDGLSHRGRFMARAQKPVRPGNPWSVWAYDELMLNADDTPQGPARGFDRNRVSAGISRRVSPVVSFDVGYLWEHGVFGADQRRDDHVALGVLYVALPRR